MVDDLLPLPRRGKVIGLLGGSFDPPHAGRAEITRQALKQFGLDRVWWLVTPGDPLKSVGPAVLERRMAAARRVTRYPRSLVGDIEARLGTRQTAETLDTSICRSRSQRLSGGLWLGGSAVSGLG